MLREARGDDDKSLLLSLSHSPALTLIAPRQSGRACGAPLTYSDAVNAASPPSSLPAQPSSSSIQPLPCPLKARDKLLNAQNVPEAVLAPFKAWIHQAINLQPHASSSSPSQSCSDQHNEQEDIEDQQVSLLDQILTCENLEDFEALRTTLRGERPEFAQSDNVEYYAILYS